MTSYLDYGYDEFMDRSLIGQSDKAGEEGLNVLLSPGIIGIEQLKADLQTKFTGATGSFTTSDLKTVTTSKGRVTSINP